jgi:type IV pilus secretin PilQ/predicted competence protein
VAVVVALVATSSPVVWGQETDTAAVESGGRSQRISLNLQNVTLGSVLKVMTQKTGINFLIGSDLVGKTINVYLEDVLVEDALAAIMKANGLWYTRQKGTNIYVIMESPEGPPVNTITQVFHTNYADAKNLEPTVTAVLTEAGSIVVDGRTNSLVISDIPENMGTLESLVKELDDPTGQVLIQAQIVEVGDEASLDLGVEWGYSNYEDGTDGRSYSGGFNYVHQWTHEQVKNEDTGEYETVSSLEENKGNEGILDLAFGKWNSYVPFQDISARIRAMQRDGIAEILAEPEILTVDNGEAEIAITSHIAMARKTTISNEGTITIEPIYGDVGVTLKVTPHINNDDFVTMVIEPTVSAASRSSFFPDEAVDTRTRTAKTTVMAQDGETIVIGGLLRKDINETHFKVPLLGDIPLLGRLFRKSIETETNTEVMVFLTPRILGPEALQRLTEGKLGRAGRLIGEN